MTSLLFAPDIEENILTALGTIFATEMVANVAGDPLALKTLRPTPLQDDPIKSAPYLTYGPDPDEGFRHVKQGEEEKMYGCIEIGGPLRFLRYYRAECGVGMYTTREAAYAAISNLMARVVQVLITYYDLSGVLGVGHLMSPDESKRIEDGNPLLVDKVTTKLEGGQQTWFGKGDACWHYPVSWYQPYRVFTGS